ncbi:MAG TPA: sigma-70 family RNA polymerase sigma factor [Pirellulales bacterium]|nr:sigma-70 family RNA polymerase sigma factor [Pirellulales bacterium]
MLVRAQHNDPLAWQRLVQLYSPLVYYWCRQARLQAADAADVVQDVFHAVARSLARFHHETQRGSFRGWLRRITVNKLRDYLRYRSTKVEGEGGSAHYDRLLALSDDALLADNEAPDNADETRADETRADETWLVLRRALDVYRSDFQEATWQAFWTVVVDGLTVAEAAVALGMTANAIYKAKSRVLNRLRTELHGLIDLNRLDRRP